MTFSHFDIRTCILHTPTSWKCMTDKCMAFVFFISHSLKQRTCRLSMYFWCLFCCQNFIYLSLAQVLRKILVGKATGLSIEKSAGSMRKFSAELAAFQEFPRLFFMGDSFVKNAKLVRRTLCVLEVSKGVDFFLKSERAQFCTVGEKYCNFKEFFSWF